MWNILIGAGAVASLCVFIGVLIIVVAIVTFIGNGVCKFFGERNSYLKFRFRDLFAGTITISLVLGILYLIGYFVSKI